MMIRPGIDTTIRDCSKALMVVLEQYDADHHAGHLRTGLLRATEQLRAAPNLHALGVKREGNHISNSKYLFYDGLLQITLDELPHGKKIPPHDHGIWEALIVCSGQFTHTIYERTDDGKVPGHADLRAIEDRIYSPGEVALVVPPSDIHGFTALPGDPTFVMTIIGGQYTPTRHYYNVEARTVLVHTPKALRESGALEVAP